jgi:hypothetical protein
MKALTLPLLALLFTITACAQSSHLDKFYQRYHNTGDSDGNSFDPGLLLNISFSGNIGTAGSDNDNWMHRITSLHCLIIDGKKTPNAALEFSDLEQSIKADHFEEWFSVRKGKGRVQLLSRDGKNSLEEVVCLIVGDDDSGLFFHLRGHFTAADKARMEAALREHDRE